MLHKKLTFALAATLLITAGCATLGGASDEEQLADLLQTWATAFSATDADTVLPLYSENFESDFSPNKEALREFLESDQAQNFLGNVEIDTIDAEITIKENQATIEPVYLGEFALFLLLDKEDDG